MSPVFQPPVVDRNSPIYLAGNDSIYPVSPLAQDLFRHYKLRAVGRSLLKNADGSYTLIDTPTQDQVNAASIAYIGGHIYEVSDAESTALTNAGYGSYIS